jgi:hypothetical protein
MSRPLQRQADALEARLGRALAALPGPAELARVELLPHDEGVAAGSRPSRILRDAAGRRYFFKAAERQHVAAEEFSYAVRSMGGRPAIPVVARTLTLEGLGSVAGMVQPLVDHPPGRLESDPTLWSPLQREVMLREHPWEWLVANLDTHVDQYILVGDERCPLNVDWDHALVDIDVIELTRFTKRSVAIAPIRNLLYDAYANGVLTVDLFGLRREVARVRRLDSRRLGALVDRYSRAVDLDAGAAALLRAKVVARKRAMRRTFDRLLASMRLERLDRQYGRGSPLRRLGTIAKDEWQRLLVMVLHDRVVRRVLGLHKEILAWRSAARAKKKEPS